MSRLENAILAVVEVFEEYAGRDDKKQQLSNAELEELLKKELSNPEFKSKIDPGEVDEVMNMLDKNHDGQVNFREFSMCIATLARGYYKKRNGKGKGKGKDKDNE
ncbi:S100 calcium binding protein W [Chanos chanos]|uniref:S100 calcium binding protein W n=1 Tax=Chanos chanos TaxID=29144 RepID=A0A6J2W5K1_CHACN|nr:protein S100-A5-like [Chanos chanos]